MLYAYPLLWLPFNRFARFFFINTRFCVAMVTMLKKNILQNENLYAAEYNKVYLNRTLLTLTAFDYLIKTFKAKSSAKIPDGS